MSNVRPYVTMVLVFWIFAALQISAAQHLTVGGATPDFLLVAALSSAVFFQPVIAAVIGFAAGVLHGGVVGADLTSLTISRTLVCYVAGYVSRLELDVRPWYVGLVVFGGTIVSYLLLMIPAPPPDTWSYVRDTIVAAMYNGVLAIPLYTFMRRTLRPRVK